MTCAGAKTTTAAHACQNTPTYLCRSHQECAAKARKILQDALTEYIIQRDAPRGRRSDSTIAAAKAAAKRVAAAVIAAGGDGSQLDAAAAGLLDLELGPAQLKKLLLPLLRLRQACCHPQVGLWWCGWEWCGGCRLLCCEVPGMGGCRRASAGIEGRT